MERSSVRIDDSHAGRSSLASPLYENAIAGIPSTVASIAAETVPE